MMRKIVDKLLVLLSILACISRVLTFECYNSLISDTRNHSLIETSNNTNLKSCYSFKQRLLNYSILIGGSLNYEPNCSYNSMFVQQDLMHINVCCNTSLCNSLIYSKYVEKNSCENNKSISARTKNSNQQIKQLLSLPNLNAPSVKQCFHCINCANESAATIVTCKNLTSSSCEYSYFYENGSKYWTGDCIETSKYNFLSYSSGRETKKATCQSDLCNSPSKMSFLHLNTTFLCEQGFYGLYSSTSSSLHSISTYLKLTILFSAITLFI